MTTRKKDPMDDLNLTAAELSKIAEGLLNDPDIEPAGYALIPDLPATVFELRKDQTFHLRFYGVVRRVAVDRLLANHEGEACVLLYPIPELGGETPVIPWEEFRANIFAPIDFRNFAS